MTTQTTASSQSVAVIGAGIVGLCAAVNLQRSGRQVTVYDAQRPGGGASYGNGGLISPDSCMPIALPGMLRKIPKWIADSTGPLAVSPRHVVSAAPWLWQWIKAGRLPAVTVAADALRQLHSPALDLYKQLLGPEKFADLIRVTGQVHVWESEKESPGDIIYRDMREKYGIQVQAVSTGELGDLVPGLSPRIKRAMLFPRHGHTINPLRLVETIADLLIEAGGEIKQERVMKLLPRSQGGLRILTNFSDVGAAQVLVAAGIWSRELLAPLGVSLPFEPERGYHIQVVNPSIKVSLPVLHKERAIGAVAMENGLRVAGTVELAGLDKPMDERKGDAMLANARAMFPTLEFDKSSLWMGFRPSTPDSVPVLSNISNISGLFVAAGHGHTGITAGASSGLLVADMMLDRPAFIDPTPYRLSRF